MKTIYLLSLLLFIFSCTNKQTKENYSIEELLTNNINDFNLPIDKAIDFKKLHDNLKSLETSEIITKLEGKNIEWNTVSQGLYIIADKYLKAGDFDNAYIYYKASALQYYNPMAMAKLARLLRTTEDKVPPFITKKSTFKTDKEEAYILVNSGLNILNVYKKHQTRFKYLLDKFVSNNLGMIDSYNMPSVQKEFDFNKAKAELDTRYKKMEQELEKIYANS